VNERIRKEFGVKSFSVIIGQLRPEGGVAVTPSLIDDVESLLIYKLSSVFPLVNRSKTSSIYVNYTLSVTCQGNWPIEWNLFFHDGVVVRDPQLDNIFSGMRARMAQGASDSTLNFFGLNLFPKNPRLSIPREAIAKPDPPTDDGASKLAQMLFQGRYFQSPWLGGLFNRSSETSSKK